MITHDGSQKALTEVHELVCRSKALTEVLHQAIDGSDKNANYADVLEIVNEVLTDAFRKIDVLIFLNRN